MSIPLPGLSQHAVDKIDLLFVVENRRSTADQERIFAFAIPDLVARLANPRCLDLVVGQPISAQPAGPLDACPTGSQRELAPVLDMHVGVLSSSLGSFGATACPGVPPPSCPSSLSTPDDDRGHLLTRVDACATSTVPTYQGLGFLAWDPAQKLSPPGIATLGAIGVMGPGSGTGLVGALHDIVVGVGSDGCVFPSQNEAWYRFLVDPTPYDAIQLVNNQVNVSGIDQVLLKQRRAFLRPDSLLVIVNLSDTDDASIREYGSYPLIADPQQGNVALQSLGLIGDKQKYGVELFYPPSRYVNALTSVTVKDVNGNEVVNPIYTNLDPTRSTGPVRDPGLVFYAAIVGAPWQLLARQDAMGKPDLINGVSALDPTQVGGFKTARELSLLDAQGNVFWDDVAGDPENDVPAKSPFMIESTTPRNGTDPITGIAISPANTPNGAGNPLNDHERTIPAPPGDIEYACIFPALLAIDESSATTGAGDCASNPPDNPLCSPNPNDGDKNTLQTKAKAYPGVKHLAIARGMGSQGIAASVCPEQVTDPTRPDYGYRPAMGAIVDRLKQALDGECLPRALTTDAEGQVACIVLEGRHAESCTCDASTGRSPVTPAGEAVVQAAMADPASKNLDCFCEIDQTSGAALNDCRTSPHPSASGWCYVDAAEGPEEAAIVRSCPATEQREIRFVGGGMPAPGAVIFIACAGA
jgi:hypothetical protein